MRRLSWIIAAVWVASLTGAIYAQKKAGGGMSRPGMATMARPPRGGTTKITGPVKGQPSGSSFVVAVPRKGPVNVDASKARFRNQGKFASAAALKPGAMVTVTGTMTGTSMAATEVDIRSIPGLRRGGARSAGRPMPNGAKPMPNGAKPMKRGMSMPGKK